MKPFRSEKLTKAANGQQCQLQIPGVCRGGTETTVACHSPLGEDRQGGKADDFATAWGCFHCHAVLDRRAKFNDEYFSDEEQRYYFHRGLVRTLANLFEKGIIR